MKSGIWADSAGSYFPYSASDWQEHSHRETFGFSVQTRQQRSFNTDKTILRLEDLSSNVFEVPLQYCCEWAIHPTLIPGRRLSLA